MALILAVLGVLALAAAAALVYLPAGLAVVGVALIIAAYVRQYMEASGATSRQARP